MKKILLIGCGTALVLIVLIVFLAATVWWALGEMCDNTISQEVYSPDGKYRAVVFERNCGATTGFSTRVSILRAQTRLGRREQGNVLVMDGHPDWNQIVVQWNDSRHVTLTYLAGTRLSRARQKIGSIAVEFKQVTP